MHSEKKYCLYALEARGNNPRFFRNHSPIDKFFSHFITSDDGKCFRSRTTDTPLSIRSGFASNYRQRRRRNRTRRRVV